MKMAVKLGGSKDRHVGEPSKMDVRKHLVKKKGDVKKATHSCFMERQEKVSLST